MPLTDDQSKNEIVARVCDVRMRHGNIEECVHREFCVPQLDAYGAEYEHSD